MDLPSGFLERHETQSFDGRSLEQFLIMEDCVVHRCFWIVMLSVIQLLIQTVRKIHQFQRSCETSFLEGRRVICASICEDTYRHGFARHTFVWDAAVVAGLLPGTHKTESTALPI